MGSSKKRSLQKKEIKTVQLVQKLESQDGKKKRKRRGKRRTSSTGPGAMQVGEDRERASMRGFGLWLADEDRQERQRRGKKTGSAGHGSGSFATLDALAAQLKAVEERTVATDSAAFNRPTARNRKQRQSLIEKEMKQYGAVIEHEAFKADPIATINEHLLNTLRRAPAPSSSSDSMDTSPAFVSSSSSSSSRASSSSSSSSSASAFASRHIAPKGKASTSSSSMLL
eukprot:CAMPEP_0174240324 /NCGR_PEP_ID=MMETSP0417-20130205/18404_1 /TAXON_ID=242541 /ORGANISM="Mayorella sp, Strain BSH-02190019" /LENGTH=226 /DNA_ID=CAMNT_0015319395 /DNA_START=161 /DNA_END=838 /DNA_ORIENTATION=-